MNAKINFEGHMSIESFTDKLQSFLETGSIVEIFRDRVIKGLHREEHAILLSDKI